MESFPAYVRLVRKRGPQPFWTPVAPLHRVFSYPLSYLYVALGLTPLTVTFVGLLMGLVGIGLVLVWPVWDPLLWWGIALLNLGVIHDACDGEVARYRLHHDLQSTKTYRVGMFADFWAFAIVVQGLIPALLGLYAFLADAHWGFAAAGVAAGYLLLASYVVGFAKSAYWPGARNEVVDESFSFAPNANWLLRVAQRVYFNLFETAMFTTHASLVLLAWAYVGGTPWWALVYVGFVVAALSGAFLVATFLAFRDFDRAPA